MGLIMRHEMNLDLVFPIKDQVSAWLMYLKAESLFEEGISTPMS